MFLRKKRMFILVVCFVLIFGVTNFAMAGSSKLLMKISGSAATVKGNHTAEFYKMLEHLIELYSDWEIEVKIYPQGTFGGSQEAVLAVRNGECHWFNQASNNFAVHAPCVWPFTFPYMFSSFEELQRVIDGPFGKRITEKALKESGVRIVGYTWAGWRAISNSVRPIRRLEDMKGLKIRVPKCPTIIETFKAWGVNPTPIGWNETFTALQQGVCDGFDNPVVVIGSFGFYEVQKYVTTLKYNPQICVNIVNEKFWQSLSPKHKAAIERALKEATEWEHGYLMWATEKYTKLCKEKGMEFYELPPEEEARWREKAVSIWPRLYKLCGEEWAQEFIKTVKKVREED